MARTDDIVQKVLDGFSEAQSNRAVFASHWDDVARVVLPYYQDSFFEGTLTQGQERGAEMFDATANTALFRFAAAMESMLTPRNGKWHRIRITDPNLNKLRRVQLWCDQVNDILFHHRYATGAGYQSQQHDGYVGQGAFGTSAIFVDRMRDPTRRHARGLRYRNIPLGELYVSENHQGDVDTVHRRFRLSRRAIVQRWGEDAMPAGFMAKANAKPEDMVFVIHHVCPRELWVPNALSGRAMPFASYYVLEDDKHLLEEGGYVSNPYCVARYITAPGEVYGRSPAMNVLPAIKGLNQQKKTFLKTMHRIADPVLLAHDDGVIDGLDLTPGAVNFGGMSAEGRMLVGVLPTGNPVATKESMDDERMAINDAFLVTLFQILVESPQMTATEVLERAREKGALLSPTMGRFQSESLGPMVKREYDVLFAQGLIPPPPPELVEAGAGWAVDYDAPLNRAMRAEEASGIQRTIQFAAEVATQTQDPSVMDHFNYDEIIPTIADISGAPFRFLNDPKTVAAKRQGRAQQAATQQAIDAGPAVAAMMKAAAPGGNALGG